MSRIWSHSSKFYLICQFVNTNLSQMENKSTSTYAMALNTLIWLHYIHLFLAFRFVHAGHEPMLCARSGHEPTIWTCRAWTSTLRARGMNASSGHAGHEPRISHALGMNWSFSFAQALGMKQIVISSQAPSEILLFR